VDLEDEKMIQGEAKEIRRQQENALTNLCVMIATPHRFKNGLEWSFLLGKMFSLQHEVGGFVHDKFNDFNDEFIDSRLQELLRDLCPGERAQLCAFLLGATQPVTLNKIELIAGA